MKKIDISKDSPYFIYTFGNRPRLLIDTGTHGDEYGVISLVKKVLLKYEEQLPDFLYIPLVSPSAVKLKVRENVRGKDLNRIFFDDSDDPEVQLNIKALWGQKFDLHVSFHEDPQSENYYVYDSGFDKRESDLVIQHNNYLLKNNIILLNGIDDPDDLSLGYEFVNGYRKFIHLENGIDDGMIVTWILNKGISRNCLLPEIPGKLELKEKEFIVDSFFKEVIIKYFQ
jgi:hypothetical protein